MRHLYRRRTVTAVPRAALVIAAVLATASASMAGSAAARGSNVAVVDFYAATPLPPVVGVDPEVLAADELASRVAHSAGAQITVIPRATVRQAESAMAWRGSDVLRFARLRELARALDADLLLVGRIDRLDLDQSGGNGGGSQGRGFRTMSAFAAVTVQVFDPRQGRIVSHVERSAYNLGVVQSRVAEQLIRRVVEATVPAVMGALSGGP